MTDDTARAFPDERLRVLEAPVVACFLCARPLPLERAYRVGCDAGFELYAHGGCAGAHPMWQLEILYHRAVRQIVHGESR